MSLKSTESFVVKRLTIRGIVPQIEVKVRKIKELSAITRLASSVSLSNSTTTLKTILKMQSKNRGTADAIKIDTCPDMEGSIGYNAVPEFSSS
jgi:hypothetical protein